MSPVTTNAPDPNQKIGDTDMNTWANAQPGRRLPTFNGGSFAIYRAQFTPRAYLQKSGGQLILRDVTGKAQVWIDGKLAGEKTDDGRNTFTVPFPPGEGERTVNVLIQASAPETPAGLGGTVTVE
jgi:beta-galactosidase